MRILSVGLVRASDDSCNNAGQRRDDLEREYLTTYHPLDERVPRFRQLPARHLVHITDLYTAEELKTSRTYNELRRCCMNTLWGWGGLARTSRDPQQEPHYRDEVEGPSHV